MPPAVSPSAAHTRRESRALVAWLTFCFAASVTAIFVVKNGWFAALVKPAWNPPSWLFAPVWSVLYAMMGVAAWLVWRVGGWPAQRRALGWFLAQWLLNALWTPLFFGLHQPGWAVVEIAALWLVLVGCVVLFWRVRPAAGVLLLPYLAWVSFAAVLNFAIWQLNS